MKQYTIYDRDGRALWTTPFEDEAWAKVWLVLGQYIEVSNDNDDTTDIYSGTISTTTTEGV